MAREDEQRLIDMMKAIEAGETQEDLDQEDMNQESGIRSIKKAPSIKMASETPGEEFDLEIMMMLKEFEDAKRNGYKGTIEDFSNYYFSQKEMMKDRQMAMYGGRMQYAAGDERPYEMKGGQKKFIDLPEKGYSTPFEAREAGDLEDRARYRELQLVKDKKGKPKPFKMDEEKIKKLIEQRKKEQEKLAKGGIAGVL